MKETRQYAYEVEYTNKHSEIIKWDAIAARNIKEARARVKEFPMYGMTAKVRRLYAIWVRIGEDKL